MHKIDRYIIKKYLGTFAFALMLLSGIAIVIDITEKIDNFLEHNLGIKQIVFDYYVYFIPWIVMMLAPIFVFISVVYFTSRLTANSEIIAMLSGRVSFYRLMLPYIFSAVFLTGIFLIANHFLLPMSNERLFDFTDKYTSSRPELYNNNVHFQHRKDTLVYCQSWNNVEKTGYRFTMEVFNGRKLIYKLSADRILRDSTDTAWKLDNYTERILYDEEKDEIKKGYGDTFRWGFEPIDFLVKINVKECMTTPELNRFIAEQYDKGAENLEFYEVERFKRTAVPISTIILTIIAFAMTTKKRRNGMGIYIVAGLALSGIYTMLQQFSTVFATKGNLEPIIGAWIPNIVFTIIGLALIRAAPK
jgi:lipopolysaccharide export system permease protein